MRLAAPKFSAVRALWVVSALLGIAPLTAQEVIRGPYLQLGTPTSVIVKWRTDIASDSQVHYGTELGNLESSADDPALVTDHEVRLTGLTADTAYYYAVGTSTQILAGGDEDHLFATSPPAGTAKPTRIWVIGDSGTANFRAEAVRDAYEAFAGTRRTDLWLMLGDNAYNTGTDAQYQAAVFDMYPNHLRSTVLWSTLGNHDAASADSATESGPYYDIFTLPRMGEAGGVLSGTEAYYSFDYGNLHFICLDSSESDRSPGSAMLTWLEDDLMATDADWVIAFWHHPPYSKGSHDSDSEGRLVQMRENVLPILEDSGVDLVLSGHSHNYERSFLLDSHYDVSTTLDPTTMILDGGDGRIGGDGHYEKSTLGPAPHEGAVYTVAGSSGSMSGNGTLDHPAMFFSIQELGSLILDVEGSVLHGTFLEASGVQSDTFTIVKAPVDGDGDGVADAADNCPADDNPDQADGDEDGNGDLCDLCPGFDDTEDGDADGVPDGCDLCDDSDDNADADGDGVPDGCDVCNGDDATGDSDGDGVCDDLDICNGSDDNTDNDGDGVPDGCDQCNGDDATGDTDDDGVCDDLDICSGNDASGDTDADGVCDDLDICNGSDDNTDNDGDGVPDGCDLCNGDDATGDTDADGVCDDLDICNGNDAAGDTDADGVCDDLDICNGSDDNTDNDGDGVPDGCDLCNGDDATGDTDDDGVCDDLDICNGDDASGDTDNDGVCDNLDICTGNDTSGDTDGDRVCDDLDICTGNDTTGDTDGDRVCDDLDLCPGFDDADDIDGDGVPDGCDLCTGDDATGDADGDELCADLDCDDNDPEVTLPDACGVCGGDNSSCGIFADGFESGDTSAWQ